MTPLRFSIAKQIIYNCPLREERVAGGGGGCSGQDKELKGVECEFKKMGGCKVYREKIIERGEELKEG